MLNRIINKIGKLLKSEENQHLVVPPSEKAIFVLVYKDIVIGQLFIENTEWKFAYSDQFKEQNELTTLIDFPNIDKEYTSSELWPFFAHRIPGLGQPQIQEIIRRENIDETNEVHLLKRFGHRSISNPFELNLSS
jgi:HipA-like protein